MPRSINTAWLSVASSVAALIVPAAYGVDGSVEWIAMCLAAIFTVLGASNASAYPFKMQILCVRRTAGVAEMSQAPADNTQLASQRHCNLLADKYGHDSMHSPSSLLYHQTHRLTIKPRSKY